MKVTKAEAYLWANWLSPQRDLFANDGSRLYNVRKRERNDNGRPEMQVLILGTCDLRPMGIATEWLPDRWPAQIQLNVLCHLTIDVYPALAVTVSDTAKLDPKIRIAVDAAIRAATAAARRREESHFSS